MSKPVLITHKAMDVWRDETPRSKKIYIILLNEQNEWDKSSNIYFIIPISSSC